MGLKRQYQIKMQQRFKRKNERKKLAAKGVDLKEYFYGKYCLKEGSSKTG